MFINPQSEYYSVSNLSNIFNSTKGKGISLVHCNIRSLTKTLTPLNDMLYSLDSRLDIIAVTETRLSSNSIYNLDVPNYNFFILIHPHVQEVQLFMLTKFSKPSQDLI